MNAISLCCNLTWFKRSTLSTFRLVYKLQLDSCSLTLSDKLHSWLWRQQWRKGIITGPSARHCDGPSLLVDIKHMHAYMLVYIQLNELLRVLYGESRQVKEKARTIER